MKYNTQEEFIKDQGIRKLGLIEYIYKLEKSGLDETKIHASLLENRVCTSPRMLDYDFKFYKRMKPLVGWL